MSRHQRFRWSDSLCPPKGPSAAPSQNNSCKLEQTRLVVQPPFLRDGRLSGSTQVYCPPRAILCLPNLHTLERHSLPDLPIARLHPNSHTHTHKHTHTPTHTSVTHKHTHIHPHTVLYTPTSQGTPQVG